MEVPLAVLADYSNISREGKLNILGIFNVIHARNFPAVHSTMQLVMKFEAEYHELDNPQKVRVKLVDEDGKMLVDIGAELQFNKPDSVRSVEGPNVLTFNNLAFSKAGEYIFHIYVNDTPKKEVHLQVRQIESK